MASKDLSVLGLQNTGAAAGEAKAMADAATTRLVKPKVISLVASAEALKICHRLLATLSEVAGTLLIAGLGSEPATWQLSVQIASGLAQLRAEKVLLLDADLRNRSVPQLFGSEPKPGLSDLICGSATVDESLRWMSRNLCFLSSGKASEIDAGQLASPAFADLLGRQLRRDFRYVVISSAPFGERPDAHLLAPHTDGVVLAIQPGLHRREEVMELNKELKGIDTRVLGIVFIEPETVGE